MNTRTVVGVDEVGRGALAGPLVVAACRVHDPKFLASLNIRESKQHTRETRDRLYDRICQYTESGLLSFATSFVTARSIDKHGMRYALHTAVRRALAKLRVLDSHIVRLDGSLFAPIRYKQARTIVRGDELYPEIALASIVAKVTRDKKMTRLAEKYPGYGFDTHVGYGTREHRNRIRNNGPTHEHRLSFCKNIL